MRVRGQISPKSELGQFIKRAPDPLLLVDISGQNHVHRIRLYCSSFVGYVTGGCGEEMCN